MLYVVFFLFVSCDSFNFVSCYSTGVSCNSMLWSFVFFYCKFCNLRPLYVLRDRPWRERGSEGGEL